MDSESSFFNSSSGGSRLLSESSFLPSSLSSSNTGPGGSDLSISELSLGDKTVRADGEELEKPSKQGKLQREEKLQNDAFLLKKLNASLKTFNDALGDVGSQNEVHILLLRVSRP
ncbi:hypothetical protein FB45DRAFT_892993 [Roridomyces roridus]|uniref:Uncharacterized protein n=1 Tax=Roridomyces roridus TaxID=1738132 RepID=A0AAD7FZ87_9AGAR|nr:hypothetical protein FB45DRAFT_892993 [Roridomyces roridus]